MPEEKACGVCENIRVQMRQAMDDRDPSREINVRVKMRRHVRDAHGRELPLPQ